MVSKRSRLLALLLPVVIASGCASAEDRLVGRVEPGVEDVDRVARREGVQIELTLDRHLVDRVVVCVAGHGRSGGAYVVATCSAVMVERMPPRGVKAPVTVMRRGWHERTRSSRISLVTAS